MANDVNEKRKVIDMAMSQIDRQYGKGSIMWLGENKRVTGKDPLPRPWTIIQF